MYCLTALTAYIIDMLIGEFPLIRHPVVLMGDFIKWFEKRFYADSVSRGGILVLSLLSLTFIISFYLELLIPNPFIKGIIASTALASNMLYKSVKEILRKPENIKFLVSRDTENLSESDINKAAVETYAENLSDGVIAPLFYLVLFGLPGAFVYKAVNTLDSMVGYRNERYEKFGKIAARVDDILNFIPARLTAILIVILSGRLMNFRKIALQAEQHDSPNAGWPIAAMAMSLQVRLGGPTSYFGEIKEKPFFGEGSNVISQSHIKSALSYRWKFDLLILLMLTLFHFRPPML